jgi:hypothetical protein
MMLEHVFFAVLLPSYPLNVIENIPHQVIQAQAYEYLNPHECIELNVKYINVLNQEHSYNRVDNFTNRIFALNSLASCQLLTNQLEEAEENIKIAEQLNIQYGSKETKIVTGFNKNKIQLIHDKDKIKNLDYPVHIKSHTKNKRNFNLIILYEIAKNIHNKDYLKAIQLLNQQLEVENYQNLSEDHKFAVQIYSYELHNTLRDYTKAQEHLNQALLILKDYQNVFLNAWLRNILAERYFNESNYAKATYNQEIAISIWKNFPKEKLNYITSLVNLIKIQMQANNKDFAYMLLNQVYMQIYGIKDTKKIITIKSQLANYFNQFNDFNIVKSLLDDVINKTHITPNSSISEIENYVKNILYLSYANIGLDNFIVAQNQLDSITNYIKQLGQDIQNQYYKQYALLEYKTKNYHRAYNYLSKTNPIIQPTKTNQYVYDTELESIIVNKTKTTTDKSLLTQLKENYQFKKINDEYSYMLYLIAIVLFLIIILIAFRLSNNNKKLNYIINQLMDKNTQIPSHINSASDFYTYIVSIVMKYNEQKNVEEKYPNNFIEEKEIYAIHIPAFSNLAIKKGNEYKNRIARMFIDKLNYNFNANMQFFKINDELFTLITNQNGDFSTKDSSNHIITTIESILAELRIPGLISVGSIPYPFLNRTPYQLQVKKIYELLLLAIFGASELSKSYNQSVWLRFRATSNENSLLYNELTRKNIVQAIKDNEIIVSSSHDCHNLDWEAITGISLKDDNN